MSEEQRNELSALISLSERRLEKRMFDLARPYVTAGALLPPVGLPRDFIGELEGLNVQELGFSEADFEGIRTRIACDSFPLPARDNREGYEGNLYYWLFGLCDCLRVMRAVENHNVSVGKILDFGGSTGRVFRHFRVQQHIEEVWACDFKKISIEWCRKHFGPAVRTFLNTAVPALPIVDNYFDVITAFSVFTHIDDLEESWLLELRRILKPGGLLYLTNADENTWKNMPDRLRTTLMQSPEAADIDFNSLTMDFDKRFFSFTDASHYSGTAFRSQSYIFDRWSQYVRILEIMEAAHAGQSVILATKE